MGTAPGRRRPLKTAGAPGYAMAALLVGMAVMAVFLTVALPAWSTMAKREREEELIFRGQQYARAIALFQRKYANTFPPSVDVLVDGKFLRKKYKDPMTKDGVFQVLYANQQAAAQGGGTVPQAGQPARAATQASATGSAVGPQGGIVGVSSKSTATSLRLYAGRNKYSEWAFVATQVTNRISAPTGSQTPTGGLNLPGGGGLGGRGGTQQPGQGRGGNQPGGRGNPNQPGRQGGGAGGGFGAPPPGAPFGGNPFGGNPFGGAPGRGR